MTMMRWDPFREARRMQETMDRLWRGLGPEADAGGMEAWTVPLDVVENDSSVVVKATVPGIDPAQLDISIEDNVLSISGERKEEREEREGRYLMRESSQGMFRRSLRLPNIIDSEQAECRYENGVLTVTFPKQERSKARRIEVKAGGESQGQIGGQQQDRPEQQQAA